MRIEKSMKTFLRAIPLFIVLMIIFYATPILQSKDNPKVPANTHETGQEMDKPKTGMVQETIPATGFAAYIHQPVSKITEKYGEPTRKDPTAYGFEWWIYNQQDRNYLQVGVNNGQVVTVFALGKELTVEPFEIGMNIDDIYQVTTLYPNFEINFNEDVYQIELSEADMNYHPLVAFDNGTFAMLMLDQVSNEILGVRYLDADVLLHLNVYEVASMTPISTIINDQLDWELVNQANEKQTLEMINVLRRRNQLNSLIENVELTKLATSVFTTYNSRTDEEIQSKGLSNKQISEVVTKDSSGAKDSDSLYLNHTSDATWVMSYWFSLETQRELLMNKKLRNSGIRYQNQEVILLLDSLDKL